MSYSPTIDIKTENGERILGCEYYSWSFKEHELLDIMQNLLDQGLAICLKGTSRDCYPFILSIPQATESVKAALVPIIEEIFAYDKTTSWARCNFERTDKEELSQEHDEWKERLGKIEKSKIADLEVLKAFPNDKGFIIEAWGTL